MIELFSGTKVMSKTFKKAGYEVFTVDNNPALEPDLVADILTLKLSDLPPKFRHPDVLWASPPCTTFSVASIGKYWKDRKPKTSETYIGLALVMKTLELIREMKPGQFFIENPRGMLRQQSFMQFLPRKEVSYCKYGQKYQKPTDIFTDAVGWIPRSMCARGSPCHERAPRGSNGGVQGLHGGGFNKMAKRAAVERGSIPLALCQEIVDYCEGKAVEVQRLIEVD